MIESLESRRLLAVTTSFSAGNLQIFGDADSNVISVRRNLDTGRLLVRVGDATIRDVAYAEVLKIYADLGSGHDKLEIALNVEKPTTVNGGEGNDTIITGNGADSVYGSYGNDILITNGGKDALFGNDGNDSLDGGFGADQFYGGAGLDGVTYAARTGAVRVTLDNRANDGSPINAELPTGEGDNVRSDIERIVGGRGADYLSAAPTTVEGVTVTPGRVTIEGGAGNDTIVGSNGGEVGSTPNSVLNGGDGNDDITGGSKNDSINGGSGIDVLKGGEGNDTILGGSGADRMYGGGGSDLISYTDRTAGVNITLDGVANDGTPPNAELLEGEKDNVAPDFERIAGGKGNDTITGSSANNTIGGGDGNDIIRAGGGNDIVEGGNGNDQIYGEGANDSLYGGLGNDSLYGGEGNDLLSAKDGLKDLLDGGPGTEDRALRDLEIDLVSNVELYVV